MRWALVLLLVAIMISGCDFSTKDVENNPVPIPEVQPEEPPGQATDNIVPEEISCEDWAASMYPYSWTFSQEVTQDPKLTREVISLRQGNWQDGSLIRGLSSTKLEPGSKSGENLNYYYSRAIYSAMNQSAFGYIYNERVVDKYGNVLGYNAFKVQPVYEVTNDFTLDEKNENNLTIKMRYLVMKMVEPRLISCEKV